MKNKIVFMDGDIPSTYFPVGKPEDGGSCAYATEECLEYCPSAQVVNKHEQAALSLFKKQNALWLAGTILDELGGQKLLQWHVWGDCLPELTEKVTAVILSLKSARVDQFGFTRNHKLWENVRSEVRVGLTVDTEREAVELSKLGLVCWPDVDRNEARLHWDGQMVARCSGWWCTFVDTGEVMNSACSYCIKKRRGCFFQT